MDIQTKLIVGAMGISILFPVLALVLYLVGFQEASIILIALTQCSILLKQYQAIGQTHLNDKKQTKGLNELRTQADRIEQNCNQVIIAHNGLVSVLQEKERLYDQDDDGNLILDKSKVN